MIGAINLGLGKKALICSGFFQEFFKKSAYRASTEQNMSTILANNSIELTTIGIHNNMWLPSYKNFRNSLRTAGVNIRAMLAPGFRWHAKIFILYKKNKPIMAIVGSSNITRNAFSVSTPFNYEADVIMWLDSITKLTSLIEGLIDDNGDPHEIILADYDSGKNSDITIEDRIKRLDEDLKEIKLNELPE